MAIDEDALYDMSDEELEAAYKAAQAEEDNAELNTEEVNDEPQEEEIIDTEEEVEDELEQPDVDQDSDDNAETEEEDSEDESDEPEDESDEPDEEQTDESNDNSEDETEESTEPVQPEPKKHKFKANGLEYEFTDQEIVEQFPRVFGQAMDYTRKMQKIKPYRQMIDAIEQAGLQKEDLNLAIDVLKGNKDAIGELLKRTGIDALDLDVEESNYVPKDYGRDETTLALEDVISEISADPEYQRTQTVLGREWDDASWNEMSTKPEMIKALHVDVKTGVFDKVQPIAAKLKVYDGGRRSDLDYYKEAAKVYFAQVEEEQLAQQRAAQAEAEAKRAREEELRRAQAEKAKRETVKKTAVKKRKAAPTNVGGGTRQTGVTDYLDESDEEFEKWYASLQEKY